MTSQHTGGMPCFSLVLLHPSAQSLLHLHLQYMLNHSKSILYHHHHHHQITKLSHSINAILYLRNGDAMA
jgi:hypothetical protein